MNKVAVIGYGSFAKQVLHHFFKPSSISELAIFDDFHHSGNTLNSYPFNAYLDHKFCDYQFIVSVGYKNLDLRKQIINELITHNRILPSLIHDSCFIDTSSTIEPGSYIFPGSTIDAHVCILNGTIINLGVLISHDTTVKGSTYISPGVVICGNCIIGEKVFIGANSSISNNIAIGDNVQIGIGTCVTKNIPDNLNVIGNPLRIINRKFILQ